MSKWITTGLMIDELRFGEIAQSDGDERIYAKRVKTGGIYTCDKKGVAKSSFYLHSENVNKKWCILPEYVSFEEAMIAHGQKRTVIYHHDNETEYKFEHSLDPNQFEDLYNDSICLHELINGKWTIE